MTMYTVTYRAVFLPTSQAMQSGFDVLLTPFSPTPNETDMFLLAAEIDAAITEPGRALTTISTSFSQIEVWHRPTNTKLIYELGGILGTNVAESDTGHTAISFRKVIQPNAGMKSGGMRWFPPTEAFGTATGDAQTAGEQTAIDDMIDGYMLLSGETFVGDGGVTKTLSLWVNKWVYSSGVGYVSVDAAPVTDLQFIGVTTQNSRKNYIR